MMKREGKKVTLAYLFFYLRHGVAKVMNQQQIGWGCFEGELEVH